MDYISLLNIEHSLIFSRRDCDFALSSPPALPITELIILIALKSKELESRLSADKGIGGQVERVKAKINMLKILSILSE